MKPSTLKNLGSGKQEELDAMGADELRAAIVNAEGNLKTIAEEMEANEQFVALRTQYKDASAGYRDGKKAQKAVIEYALALLEAKGVPAGSDTATNAVQE